MRSLTCLYLAILIALSVSLAAAEKLLVDVFQAKMVVTIEENSSVTNLWAKSGLIRFNTLTGRTFNSSITDYKQQKSWALSSTHMVFQEFSSKQLRSYVPEFFNPDLKIEKKFIAEEEVNGILAKKYRATIKEEDNSLLTGYLWESVKLPGYPLQWEQPSHRIHAIWENAKLVVKDASFFKIPANYREQKTKVKENEKEKE